jgi:hypothetical protein
MARESTLCRRSTTNTPSHRPVSLYTYTRRRAPERGLAPATAQCQNSSSPCVPGNGEALGLLGRLRVSCSRTRRKARQEETPVVPLIVRVRSGIWQAPCVLAFARHVNRARARARVRVLSVDGILCQWRAPDPNYRLKEGGGLPAPGATIQAMRKRRHRRAATMEESMQERQRREVADDVPPDVPAVRFIFAILVVCHLLAQVRPATARSPRGNIGRVQKNEINGEKDVPRRF